MTEEGNDHSFCTRRYYIYVGFFLFFFFSSRSRISLTFANSFRYSKCMRSDGCVAGRKIIAVFIESESDVFVGSLEPITSVCLCVVLERVMVMIVFLSLKHNEPTISTFTDRRKK